MSPIPSLTSDRPQTADAEPQVRIASFPGNSRNPYLELFYQALARHGIQWIGPFEPDGSRPGRASAAAADVLHFHWPEPIWRRRFRGRLDRVRAIVELGQFLRRARRQGIVAIWTVHNVEPHEDANGFDRLGYCALAWGCELLISHSDCGRDEAARVLFCRRNKFVVMPIGSYIGRLPEPQPPECVRAELGLKPDMPTVVLVGGLRPYKGISLACEAVAALPGVQLLLAGPCQGDLPPFDAIRGMLGERLAIVPRVLSDQEVSDFVGAGDAVLLPYSKITGSAALLTAFSLRRPVVTSDLPYFREILALEPQAGIIAPREPAALAEAINKLLTDELSSRQSAAYRLAEHFAWDRVVGPLAEALHARVSARRTRTGSQSSVLRP